MVIEQDVKRSSFNNLLEKSYIFKEAQMNKQIQARSA